MNPKVYKSLLPSGLRVIIEPHSERKSVHVGLSLFWGSKNEEDPLFGAAHLIEHMVFKGTQKRSAYQIIREVESLGAEIGASTGREMTTYNSQCLAEDLPQVLEILEDMCFHATFPEEEFEKEKQVVLSEIAMSEENYEEIIYDMAFDKIFGKQPLSRPIAGSEQSVKGIGVEDLKKLYPEKYRPENFVLSLVGGLDADQALKDVERIFSSKNISLKENINKLNEVKKPSEEALIFHPAQDYVQNSGCHQNHLLINFKAPEATSPERWKSYLLSTVLGGGMSSVLYQKIREELGAAYSVYAYLQSFVETGVLSLYLALNTERNLDQSIEQILETLKELSEKGLSEEDFKMYKKQLTAEFIMDEEELEYRVGLTTLNEFLFGDPKVEEQALKEMEKIDSQDFNRYIKEQLSQAPAIICMGPGSKPDFFSKTL